MRHCIRCNTQLTACMGFCLARDVIEGRGLVRELCGRCALITEPEQLDDWLGRRSGLHVPVGKE